MSVLCLIGVVVVVVVVVVVGGDISLACLAYLLNRIRFRQLKKTGF
jgi:hypothetical protein